MDTPSASLPSPESRVNELLTVSDAAALLGVNRFTFYRWLKRGYLPHHRFGRTVRVGTRDLAAFVEKNRECRTPLAHAGAFPPPPPTPPRALTIGR